MRFWYNFATNHANVAYAADAAEYLRVAQGLNQAAHLPLDVWMREATDFGAGAAGLENSQIHKPLSCLSELSRGGPIFPLFILLSGALFGVAPDFVNWWAPVIVQSVLSAFTCVLIAVTARNLWSEKEALVAGLMSALYPAFIINSGRLYSETFAVFLFICLVLIISTRTTAKANPDEKPSYAKFILLGVVAAALQMTRSVMAGASLLVVLFLIFDGKGWHKRILSYILGFAIMFGPWLFIQQCAFGHASFVVNRNGQFTFFLGNNCDTQGWLSFPAPDLTDVNSSNFQQLITGAVKRSPERWCKLMLDKPARLLATPWNDYRSSIGVLSPGILALVHQILLMLGVVGLITSLMAVGSQKSREESNRLRIVLLCCYHGVYFFFITMSRYALPPMSCVILFAAAALVSIVEYAGSSKNRSIICGLGVALLAFFVSMRIDLIDLLVSMFPTALPSVILQGILRGCSFAAVLFSAWQLAVMRGLQKNKAAAVALAVLIIALPSISLPLRAFGRWYEWRQSFDRQGDQISVKIVLTDTQLKQMCRRQAYVIANLANGDYLGHDLAVTINGIKLPGPFIPAMSLAQAWTAMQPYGDRNIRPLAEYILADMTSGFPNLSPLGLRDWFLIPIDQETLKQLTSQRHESNSLPVTLTFKKIGQHSNSVYGSYSSSQNWLMIPSIDVFSWEKGAYSPENDSSLGDLSLDTKVKLDPNRHHEINGVYISVIDKPATRIPYIHILLSPDTDSTDLLRKIDEFPVDRVSLSSAKETRFVEAESSRAFADSTELVRFTGDLVNADPHDKYKLDLVAVMQKLEGGDLLFSSVWLPAVISPQANSTRLDYVFPLNLASAHVRLKKLAVQIQKIPDSAAQEVQIDSAKVRTSPATLEKASFHVYDLPSNPVGKHHEIL